MHGSGSPVRSVAAALLVLVVGAGSAGCGGSPGSVAPGSVAPGSVSPSSASIPPPSEDPQAIASDEPGLPDASPLPDPGEGGIPAYERTIPIGARISTGASLPAKTATIGSAGGTIEAAGLRIEVPAGALAGDTAFSVASRPIERADVGGLVAPITRLYDVLDSYATLAVPVSVTFSATIPAGKIAMAFSYDEATGALAPLIPISQGATSLTAGATHFSSIFGGVIEAAKVPPIVDSGFRPGTDDWQFSNRGSYVAPGGQCEGQSLSEIWYYVKQRVADGASPLHGLYDNNGAEAKTPAFWQDDSDGYRLVGSVQADKVANRFTYLFLRNAMWGSADGQLTYEAFRAAIALTGQPQLIRISTDTDGGGHTMIVYRVTPDWLLVADPNYPGIGRRIRFDPASGKLGPFLSGNNAAAIAAGSNVSYSRFAYVPWQSSVSEATVAAHWAEFESDRAGDAVFPGYNLLVASGKDADGKPVFVPLTNEFTTAEPSVEIEVGALYDGSVSRLYTYRGTSSTPIVARPHFKETLNLEPGENAFGFAIWGRKGNGIEYVDFVRLTIIRDEQATPTPEPTAGEANETLDLAITTEVASGGEDSLKCPAEVHLRFFRNGGNAGTMEGMAGLSAICTNVEFMAIDANGTFDGTTFTLGEGRWAYTGTFDGSQAVITGPGGATLTFPVP